MRPYLKKTHHKKGLWSGSRFRSWVQTPATHTHTHKHTHTHTHTQSPLGYRHWNPEVWGKGSKGWRCFQDKKWFWCDNFHLGNQTKTLLTNWLPLLSFTSQLWSSFSYFLLWFFFSNIDYTPFLFAICLTFHFVGYSKKNFEWVIAIASSQWGFDDFVSNHIYFCLFITALFYGNFNKRNISS
jgi:hypothetical protein